MNRFSDQRDPSTGEVTPADLGRRLKQRRLDLKLSLQDLADGAKLSRSFISQLERGTTSSSIGTLKRICAVLEIPVWSLLEGETAADPMPAGHAAVVRKADRSARRLPNSNIVLSLLTPDLHRRMKVSLSVLQPGDGYGSESYTHRGEEFGLVLAGTYEVTVADRAYVLEAGDTIYFRSTLPHRTRVVGDNEVTTLWISTPPS